MSKRSVSVDGIVYVDAGPIDLDAEPVYLSDGTRLTEDLAEELAEEVLRSAGRPSLSSRGQRSPQLRLSVPAELDLRLRSRAARENRTISELTREALERYLAG
jgi:hypothetical protein